MSPSDEQIRGAIAEQASEWFMENRSGLLDHKESVRFMAWLQASPMHVEEYLRIAAIAPDLEAAAKTNKTPREILLARARGEPDGIVSFDRTGLGQMPVLARRRRSPVWSLAAAAALAVVAVTTVWSMRDGERFGLSRSYSTVRGEQRFQRLPDGSVLHLNTDSAVTVHYSRMERLVSLDRGQALFEVAHRDQRAFRVQTGRAGSWRSERSSTFTASPAQRRSPSSRDPSRSTGVAHRPSPVANPRCVCIRAINSTSAIRSERFDMSMHMRRLPGCNGRSPSRMSPWVRSPLNSIAMARSAWKSMTRPCVRCRSAVSSMPTI